MTALRAVFATLGVSAAVQAAQPVPAITGIFADPVVVFILRIFSIILSSLITGTIFWGAIRLVAAVGRLGKTNEMLAEEAKGVKQELREFAKEIRAVLMEHHGDISSLKAGFADHDRRLGTERRHGSGRREANHHDTPAED